MGTQHIERAKQWLNGEIPLPPIARLIGFRPVAIDIEKGEVTLELEATEKHTNPMGTLHGGVLCDVADLAMGMVFAASIAEGETFTTIELKINFFRPVFKEKIYATARMVKRGKTVGMVECDVKNESGSLVARVSSTCMALRGQAASGR